MNELLDKFLLDLFEGLQHKITVLFGTFIADAQALAAIFMLLYFGIEAYKMMAGDKQMEIVALLRPFALGLVLIFWIPFVNLIQEPASYVTATSKAMFYSQLDEIEALSRHRYALIDSVSMELMSQTVEIERAEDEVKEGKWYEFGIDFSAIGDKIKGLWLMVVAKVKYLLFQVIEWLCVTIWQVCIYLVFFLQIVFTGILVILGPLSFAFSILPAFRDAYIQWISRFISVSLYACIAYLILSVSCVVMQYGLEKEIEILEFTLVNDYAFIAYTTLSSGGVNMFVVTCLLGAIAMLTIPFISTWIISTTGVGHAVAAFAGGTVAAVKGVTKAVGTAATAGAGGGGG